MVYCSRYLSDERGEAGHCWPISKAQPLTEPRVIKFRPGQRRRHWNKNCVAMGLSSGFIEPLESTSIHLIQRAIIRLLQMFPHAGIKQPDVDEFNQQTADETASTSATSSSCTTT